ncbi:MAG: hypothetical protein LBM98_03160 [Oscillospiraceae bacterium]|nr:hypothetical protein [Oscillospiraceae bacterium]
MPRPAATTTHSGDNRTRRRQPRRARITAHGAGAGRRPARLCEAVTALAIRTIEMRRSNPGLT